MTQYIWQSSSWPRFQWNSAELLLPLGKARLAQGEILAKAAYFELKTAAEVLTEEAIATAAIEGEKLNRDAVHSSVTQRMGLPTTDLPTVKGQASKSPTDHNLHPRSNTAEILPRAKSVVSTLSTKLPNQDGASQPFIRLPNQDGAGLPSPGPGKAGALSSVEQPIDGLVEMLIDATRKHDSPLAIARLKRWQATLFPYSYSGLRKIAVGSFRSGAGPLPVILNPINEKKIKYLAPPAQILKTEIKHFLDWFDSPPGGLDGLVRAAIAHFWFVSIHPFQDGNGRIARAIADMALAQDEKKNCRLYSMSAQIMTERDGYYDVLEKTLKDGGDLTLWIAWFLECLERAVRRSNSEMQKSMDKARMWQQFSHLELNSRQRKVVNLLSDAGPAGFEGGLTNLKYREITATTRETAKRDMADLVEKKILVKYTARGRNAGYDLV